MDTKHKNKLKAIRTHRTRAKIFGTSNRPRLSVFRSNKAVCIQLIDDENGRTLAAVSTIGSDGIDKKKAKKTDLAFEAGKALAKKATTRGILKAVFDRRGYKYHGRVRAVAEGAREGGLKL